MHTRGDDLMKKQQSLILRLSLVTIGAFLLLFLMFNVITNTIIFSESRQLGEENVTLANEMTAAKIGEKFSETIAALEQDQQLLLTLIESGQLTSDFIIDFKTSSLENDPSILGYAVIIEANELNYTSPKHVQYIDQKGFFAPYIVKTNNTISIETLPDATSGIWYSESAQSKKLSITEPYEYIIQGQAIPMMTITIPLIKNGDMIGATVVDMPLNFLQSIIERYIPKTAIQRVASPEGMIITDSGSTDNINQPLEPFVPNWPDVLSAMQAGENIDLYADSVTFGEKAYATFSPVLVENYDKHLIVETFIPTSTILGAFYRVLRISIIAAVVIAVLLAGAVYFFIRRALKPLKPLQQSLTLAANGDLSSQLKTKILMDNEIGAVGRAYNKMREQVADVVNNVATQATELEQTSEQANRSVEEVSQSSLDMSRAIQDITVGAQSQANEIDAANQEMTALGLKMDELSNVAHYMLDNVEQSNKQAHRGKNELHKLHVQSEQTANGNAALEQQMTRLADQITQIDHVMHSIQGITEQTNLLALNASIEAARAGEHGKGFAVVAEEVRKLAEQSRQETKQVQQIVLNILYESEQTKSLAAENSAIFQEQLQAVTSTEQAFSAQLLYAEQIELQIQTLLHQLEQMMQDKERVITSMQGIAAISEQSAASAEEISASAEEQYNEIARIVALMNNLYDISIELKGKTKFFTI